jgi:hypothetical protein
VKVEVATESRLGETRPRTELRPGKVGGTFELRPAERGTLELHLDKVRDIAFEPDLIKVGGPVKYCPSKTSRTAEDGVAEVGVIVELRVSEVGISQRASPVLDYGFQNAGQELAADAGATNIDFTSGIQLSQNLVDLIRAEMCEA